MVIDLYKFMLGILEVVILVGQVMLLFNGIKILGALYQLTDVTQMVIEMTLTELMLKSHIVDIKLRLMDIMDLI